MHLKKFGGAFSVGEAFRRLAAKSSASVGPLCNGEFVARAWRFWAQGDEFYTAQRDSAPMLKISFHSRGNWHMDLGTERKLLGTPRECSLPGWGAGLQLKFIVHEEITPAPMLKKLKPSTSVIGVNVPIGSKLLVNVLTAPEGTTLESAAPPEFDGVHLLLLRLRSGSTVMLTGMVSPLDAQDFELIERMQGTTVSFTGGESQANKPTAEMMQITFEPGNNVISVAPFRAASFKISPG